MDRWEYKIIRQYRRTSGIPIIAYEVFWEPEIDFDELGQKGWELASVAPLVTKGSGTDVTDTMIFYFKRKTGY